MMMMIKYCQGYAQIKEVYRALKPGDNLQTYISDDDFRSTKAGVVEDGYNLYVFHIGYKQNFTDSQPIKVELNLIELFLTMKMCLLWC